MAPTSGYDKRRIHTKSQKSGYVAYLTYQWNISIKLYSFLELEAYSHLVSALRAQGPLNQDKRKLLKETSIALNITQERHKAEVRRAISDEKLNTIAYQ